ETTLAKVSDLVPEELRTADVLEESSDSSVESVTMPHGRRLLPPLAPDPIAMPKPQDSSWGNARVAGLPVAISPVPQAALPPLPPVASALAPTPPKRMVRVTETPALFFWTIAVCSLLSAT